MASLRDYITDGDCTNKLFERFPEATRLEYIEQANLECEDLAVRLGVEPTEISAETHFKLKRYLVNYAYSLLAQDNIGKNNTGVDIDKYETWFKRTQYLLQGIKPQVTKSVLTGVNETAQSRAVRTVKIYRS